MSKVLITGKNGLLGNALKTISNLYDNEYIFVGKDDFDLMNPDEIKKMLRIYSPDVVVNTAASVGGIGLNLKYPSLQFFNNIIMNTNMIHESMNHNVKKFINFSSVCAFPNHLETIQEDLLHDGEPFHAHLGYAHAKRISDIQIGLYRKEFNLNYCSIIPVNIFGKHDNYNLEKGHVIPSLIHKCFISKNNKTKFQVWGDGEPRREFIYSEDLAIICLELLKLDSIPQKLIASPSIEYSIKEIVDKICNFFNYYDVEWLTDKPNGQLRRPSDTTLLKTTLPNLNFSSFDDTLKISCQWFIDNYPNLRL
jgi:GDP-L-fucose synthase